MASKKELEKTKELARLYYLNGDTQKLVAEKVGVSRVTVNKWVSDGGWDALRTAKSITRKELVAKIMKKADEKLENGDMSADEMAKLAASIEKIDKRTSATTIIEVLTSYNNWLAARTQIDKELTVDFLKMTNRYQDIFIAEQVSAETYPPSTQPKQRPSRWNVSAAPGRITPISWNITSRIIVPTAKRARSSLRQSTISRRLKIS